MRPTPYVASLRIYEPFESFNPRDQNLWSTEFSNSQTIFEEQHESLRKSVTLNYSYSKIDGAHFLTVDNKRYISPWSTAIRTYNAFDDFTNSLPSSIVNYFIPKVVNDSIQNTLQNIEDKVSHILSSTWSIPPRWFALFSPEERIRGVGSNGHFCILRTSISNAKDRCTFTHQAVMSAFGEGIVAGEVAELSSWLEIFDRKSIVELDYGGLATYLHNSLLSNGESGLEADSSIEDVNSSIAGLASGDGALAGKGYERLVTRWRRVAAFESAS
jgi:hypothetical protein